MNCETFRERAFDYLQGSLQSDAGFEAHRASCASCAAALEGIRHNERILSASRVPTAPPDLWPRIAASIGKDGRGDPGGTKEGRPVDDEVQRALQQLSPKLRTVISLRYLEGLSYEEIAEILEISIGTVKSRLFLAHETLRPLLKDVRLEGDA